MTSTTAARPPLHWIVMGLCMMCIGLAACAADPAATKPVVSITTSEPPVPDAPGVETAQDTATAAETAATAGIEATTPAETAAAPTAAETGTETPTPIPANTAPLVGTFDVYLGAPRFDGGQLLRWVDVATGEKVTEITIFPREGTVVRAGTYVYYTTLENQVRRVNSAGAVQDVVFAAPPADSDFFHFLPSANGDWLVWMHANTASGAYTIERAFRDGANLGVLARGADETNSKFVLLRVANDGSTVFFAVQPEAVEVNDDSPFGGVYEVVQLDTTTAIIESAPGEPACGDGVCSAHVSPDGAFLARTPLAGTSANALIVTNLVSGQVIARFTPPDLPAGSAYQAGYPFFTPGGEIIYMVAVGPEGQRSYRLYMANIVTDNQQVIADFGAERHHPLGWTGGGFILLTTREPGIYDTWQIDSRDGSVRQIAGMLFLGTVIQE